VTRYTPVHARITGLERWVRIGRGWIRWQTTTRVSLALKLLGQARAGRLPLAAKQAVTDLCLVLVIPLLLVPVLLLVAVLR
jgi:hypothetical protein